MFCIHERYPAPVKNDKQLSHPYPRKSGENYKNCLINNYILTLVQGILHLFNTCSAAIIY